MSKRKSPKRSTTQKILWGLSLFLILSMVISLFVVAFEQPPATETPTPAYTPFVPSTATPVPNAVPSQATQSPTAVPTEPITGPELPTATTLPTVAPTAAPTAPPPTATPSAAQPALLFAVAGDSRENPAVYRRVLDSVAASGSQFLVHTGDMVSNGSDEEWHAFGETMAGFSLPFYPVPGNHDGQGGKLDGFLRYSGAPAAHYSFDRGPVHVTLADSHNGGIGLREMAWLRKDLAATAQPLRMVVLHHPPFDPDGTDHVMAFGNQTFMALMEELQVQYVFAGHIHAYAQEARNGVVYTYTGGAGAPLYAGAHAQAFYHYLLVRVAGETVTVEVVRV